MPSEFRLLEDQLTVARDLEPTAARWLELDVDTGETRAKLGRQTGGPRFVASNRAVLDFDFHVDSVRKPYSEIRQRVPRVSR